MTKKDILTLITFLLFLLSGAILLTILCQPLFVWQLSSLNTKILVGLSPEQVIDNYNLLLHYLLNPFHHTLNLPDFAMSSSGAFHFYEVKQLFLLNNTIAVLSGIGSVFGYKHIKNKVHWHLFERISRYIIVVPLVIVIVLATSFDFWFVLFHKMAFGNNDWLFNPMTDPIILVLPESFFLSCFILVFCIIECGALLFWWHCRQKTQK